MGFGGKVFHNRFLLSNHAVVLEVGDVIICDPYRLRVIAEPDTQQLLQEIVEKVLPESTGEPEFADSETDFLLNID